MEDQMQGINGAISNLSDQNQQAVSGDVEKRKKLLKEYLNQPPPDSQVPTSAISQALGQLSNPNTRDPAARVGKAIGVKDYSNLCLGFVDDMTGNKTDRSPSAYADYQKNAARNNIQTKGSPPKGARIYFAPTPSNPAGHVMLSNGDGTGTGSTTSEGIKTFKISDWEKYANQQYIGYAPPGSK